MPRRPTPRPRSAADTRSPNAPATLGPGAFAHVTSYGAIANDRNHDGVLNDAPDSVPDFDDDGDVDEQDLQAFGAPASIRPTS